MNADKLGREAARVAASELAARTVMILHDDDAADRSMATGFAVMFANEGGEVLAKSIPQGKGDVAGLLSGLRQIPDVLFLAADTSSAAEWIKAAREAGFDGTIVGGPEVGSALTVDIAGPAGEGVLFVSPFALAPDDPAFQSAYETLSGGVAPGPVAAWCYAAARDMLDAMDATMRTSRQPWRPGVSAALASRLAGEAAIAVYVIRDGQVFTPAGY
jgi:branched-chain amino acid transport system substrate-binding protein